MIIIFFSLDSTSPTSSEQQSPTPSNMLEEVNVQYLKELQAEKESLGTNVTEDILKGHALKLLENGKYCMIVEIFNFKNTILPSLVQLQLLVGFG